MSNLSGKKWFYSMGQRDASVNKRMLNRKQSSWPAWARSAYVNGFHGL
jgi:hypothetical protein